MQIILATVFDPMHGQAKEIAFGQPGDLFGPVDPGRRFVTKIMNPRVRIAEISVALGLGHFIDGFVSHLRAPFQKSGRCAPISTERTGD